MPDEGSDGPGVATIDSKAPAAPAQEDPPADAVTITIPHPLALLRRFAAWIAPPPPPQQQEDDAESGPPRPPRRPSLAKTLLSDDLPRAATITVTILAVVAIILTGISGSSTPASGADPGGTPAGSPFPEPGSLDDEQPDGASLSSGAPSPGSAVSPPPLAVAVNPPVISPPAANPPAPSPPAANPPPANPPAPSPPAANPPAAPSSRPSSAPLSPTSGIPARARAAYTAAASQLAVQSPACKLPWTLLAAIGRIESNHGRAGRSTLIASSGRAAPAIYGVRLDGAKGVPVVRDTDRGRLDADPGYDRAVGPMQLLPGTWPLVAVDADRDGAADPQDIDDAALTAGRYLCTGVTAGSDLSTQAGQWNAAYRFKRSADYANVILAVATTYATGQATTVTAPPAGATTRIAG